MTEVMEKGTSKEELCYKTCFSGEGFASSERCYWGSNCTSTSNHYFPTFSICSVIHSMMIIQQ